MGSNLRCSAMFRETAERIVLGCLRGSVAAVALASAVIWLLVNQIKPRCRGCVSRLANTSLHECLFCHRLIAVLQYCCDTQWAGPGNAPSRPNASSKLKESKLSSE